MATKTIAQLTAAPISGSAPFAPTTIFEIDDGLGNSWKLDIKRIAQAVLDSFGAYGWQFPTIWFESNAGDLMYLSVGNFTFQSSLGGYLLIDNGLLNYYDKNNASELAFGTDGNGNFKFYGDFLNSIGGIVVDQGNTFYDSGGNPGFTGSGTFTNFTISGGIITAAS